MQPVGEVSVPLEVVAYGRLEEDPARAFVVRAPVAGTLASEAGWPRVGQVVSSGQLIGTIEPRFTPMEQFDLLSRLNAARAQAQEAAASLAAEHTTLDQKKLLHDRDHVVSDRSLAESQARVKVEQARTQHAIRDILTGYPGITSEVVTFLGDRISESVSGETSAVVISLFGNDLDVLDAGAQEVARVVSGIAGAVDVRVASPPGAPETVVRIRPERLLQFGLQPVTVLDAIQTAYQGTVVGQSYISNQVIDVVVTLDPDHRRDPETLGRLTLRSPDGTTVRLAELAELYPTTGRYMILHDGARRRQAVTCNVEGRDVSSFVAVAARRIRQTVHLPPPSYIEFGGVEEARAGAQRELLLHSSLAGVGILLLLASVFRTRRNMMLVLANLPFALVGGVLAVYFTGSSLSIGSLVGFVTLFGITMRNSVMTVSRYEHLVAEEGLPWGRKAALRGASEPLLPILMTALVTGLGLLPIALGSGEVGREIEGPMAVVITGGLTTSTLLNLLLLPTLSLLWGRFPATTPGEPLAPA